MIYISIDNDHQGALALRLIEELHWNQEMIQFISHTSIRNNIVSASEFSARQVRVALHPLCDGSGFKNPQTYLRAIIHQTELQRKFRFYEEDILIVTTEYEINNALLARKMKKAGGSIYIFDEGIGFYFNNSPFNEMRLSKLDKFFLTLYDLALTLLRIPAYAKKGFEGRMYVRIREQYIDAIYSRMRLPVDRPVEIRGYRNFLASDQAALPKHSDNAIFFAGNLESFGLKKEGLLISAQALRHMAKTFSVVHLKIHPADWAAKNDVYMFYISLIEEHPNLKVVDNAMSGNDALETIRPSIVVGMLGATMFDAFFFGCQPVFLFHLLPPTEEFNVCAFTLNNLGYRYINRVAQIGPEYMSGVDVSSLLYEDRLVSPLSDWPPQGDIKAVVANSSRDVTDQDHHRHA
jgi:hypothetical protein